MIVCNSALLSVDGFTVSVGSVDIDEVEPVGCELIGLRPFSGSTTIHVETSTDVDFPALERIGPPRVTLTVGEFSRVGTLTHDDDDPSVFVFEALPSVAEVCQRAALALLVRHPALYGLLVAACCVDACDELVALLGRHIMLAGRRALAERVK